MSTEEKQVIITEIGANTRISLNTFYSVIGVFVTVTIFGVSILISILHWQNRIEQQVIAAHADAWKGADMSVFVGETERLNKSLGIIFPDPRAIQRDRRTLSP